MAEKEPWTFSESAFKTNQKLKQMKCWFHLWNRCCWVTRHLSIKIQQWSPDSAGHDLWPHLWTCIQDRLMGVEPAWTQNWIRPLSQNRHNTSPNILPILKKDYRQKIALKDPQNCNDLIVLTSIVSSEQQSYILQRSLTNKSSTLLSWVIWVHSI